MFAICRSLCVARCWLTAVRCLLLFADRCSLFAVCCLLFVGVVRCRLFVVRRLLADGCCVMFVVCCELFVVVVPCVLLVGMSYALCFV